MKLLLPGVYLLESILGSNVYLLEEHGDLFLIDAGLMGQGPKIVQQLHEYGGVECLNSVILTHAHGDHSGSAAWFAKNSNAEIAAHEDDATYIKRGKPLPNTSRVMRRLVFLAELIVLKRPPCQVKQILHEKDIINVLGGLHVIHTPGHTPGSICLYQLERRLLFCGDALMNLPPIPGMPSLAFPIAPICMDAAQARQSIKKLASLQIEVILFGHREPLMGGGAEKINELLDRNRMYLRDNI